MEKRNLRRLVVLGAAIATATHFVRADGRFLFADKNESEYVQVSKASILPMRFRFSRCKAESGCNSFGKKAGYTLEEIRIQSFKLIAKREKGKLSSPEARDLDTLQEIIQGIESPTLHYPSWTYTHNFRISAEQFVDIVEKRLGEK